MGRSFAVKAVHKQMYPATYNFRDEADGTSGTDIGFIDVDTSDADCVASIIASFEGHRKVLQLFDNNGGGNITIIHDPDSIQTDLTTEFYWASSNVLTGWTLIEFKEVGNIRLRLLWDNNLVRYNNGAGWITVKTGLSINTWYHNRLVLDDTTNTFDWWIDGVSVGTGLAYYSNTTVGIDRFIISSETGTANYYIYIDAWGESWDANYNVGDNCFDKYYKESTDSFEGDDVGTRGTVITWVDSTNDATSQSIENDFDEHKKFLRQIEVTGNDYSYHYFASQALTGWCSFWARVSDISGYSIYELREGATQIISLLFDGGVLNYYDGNTSAYVASSFIPVNDTWCHIYVRWYDAATDTFDLWVNNVLIAENIQTLNNMTSGVNRFLIRQYDAGDSCDIDSPISSLDGDEKGDNRTFDYNDSYTRKDVTTDIENVFTRNMLGKWREGDLFTKKDYENSEIFVQIYDINSKLAMEAELKKRDQVGEVKHYPLRDKNEDDLKYERSHVFSAAKIHDPTDSTCMLKVILPNLSEADGDLILVDADTKTDTYSPTIKNRPDYKSLIDIQDLADSILIVHADGKCYLDDDKASGTSLDVDVEVDKDNMTGAPLVTDILEEINYFVIKGNFDPETGQRFYKIIDNTAGNKKRSWRYTNNSFLTQTDVDNYAAKLEVRAVKVKLIKFTAQSLGAHNMGETVDFKFVTALYNVPRGNYYVKYEEIDYDANENTIILSEGMIEESKYAAAFEVSEEYNDAYAGTIYETDIIPVFGDLFPRGGAASGQGTGGHWGIVINAAGEGAVCNFHIGDKIDPSRQAIVDVVFTRDDANNDAFDVIFIIYKGSVNGGTATQFDSVIPTMDACAQGDYEHYEYIISAANLIANTAYYFRFNRNDFRDFTVNSVTITYYQKRSV